MLNEIYYKWFSVQELYDYCHRNALPLLSTFYAPFWGQYILDYEKYDRYFSKRYRDFVYYNQHPINNIDVDSVAIDFIESVNDYLMVNEKKYTELFKLQLMNFGDNIQYDFYAEDTKKRIVSRDGNYIYGSRTDNENALYGGSTDTTSATVGAHSVSNNDTTEKQKMAFDSTAYINDTRDSSTGTENVSARNDSSSVVKGSRTDTASRTKGKQTDDSIEHENEKENNVSKGYRESPIKNIERFRKYWNGYSFYGNIFDDIAKEILIV